MPSYIILIYVIFTYYYLYNNEKWIEFVYTIFGIKVSESQEKLYDIVWKYYEKKGQILLELEFLRVPILLFQYL